MKAKVRGAERVRDRLLGSAERDEGRILEPGFWGLRDVIKGGSSLPYPHPTLSISSVSK